MAQSAEPRLLLKTTVTLMANMVTLVLGIAVATTGLSPWIVVPSSIVLLEIARRLAHFHLLNVVVFSRYSEEAQHRILRWMTIAGIPHAVWLSTLAFAESTRTLVWLFVALPLLGLIEYLAARYLDWLWLRIALRAIRLAEEKAKAEEAAEERRKALAAKREEEEAQAAAAEANRLPAAIQVLAEAALDRKHEHSGFDFEGAYALMKESLTLAGYGYLKITAITPVIAGGGSVTFEVQVPSKAAARLRMEADAVANGQKPGKDSMPVFDSSSRAGLAIALGEVSGGQKVPKGALRIQDTDYEGVYEVVLLVDAMRGDRDVLVYHDEPRWHSLDELCPIGMLTGAGGEARIDVRGHIQIIAQSEGGKTNVFMLILAWLLCTRSVVWIGGARKQYESWGILLDRYLNKNVPLPIDWLAQGVVHTVDQLLAALFVMNYRQTVPLAQRSNLPPLFLLIDEAAEIFRNTAARVWYRGEWCNASELLEKLYQGAKSAGIYIILAKHRDTADQLGDRGKSINSGVDLKIILRTDDIESIGRMTADYKLPPLRHAGELYLHQAGQAAQHATARYMQEPLTKPKALRTDGTPVTEVGWARRQFVADRQLDEGSQRAAEKATKLYAARHKYFTPEMLAYLTTDEELEKPAPTGAEPQAPRAGVDAHTAALNAQFDALLAARDAGAIESGDGAAGATSAAQTAPAPVASAVVVAEVSKPTRRDMTITIVEQHGPMGSAEIIKKLEEAGYAVDNRTSFLNQLSDLVARKILVKDEATRKFSRSAESTRSSNAA